MALVNAKAGAKADAYADSLTAAAIQFFEISRILSLRLLRCYK
jgi:hypothetical protein